MPRSPALLALLPLFSIATLAACDGEDNQPPGAPDVRIGPNSPKTGDDLVAVIVSDSSDPDGDTVTYTYRWFQSGLPRTDLATDTVPAAETARGEEWEVIVTPNDGASDGSGASATATILNTAPTASVVIVPASPGTDEDLKAEVTSEDPDADAVTYTYVWTRDGVVTSFTDASVPARDTKHGETWTVTVTPNDGAEDGTPVTASVVVANSAPSLEAVTLNPASAHEDSLIVATVSGADDLDGDRVSLTYSWYVNDIEVLSSEDDTLTGAWFDKHDLVRVEVTPNDGYDDGAVVGSDDVLVENTVPSGTRVSVISSSADGAVYEASTLTCTPVGWADADGDVESWTYAWSVDGVSVSTAATIDGALFGKDDVVACTATPTDGEASGATLTSRAVSVSNSAPELASATLSTSAPTESDTVSVTLGAASDDDGDAISYSYTWYVDGLPITTSDTLLPSRFEKGDRIEVTVTPYDGTDLGSPVTSASAIAANSAPSVRSVTLSPSAVYTDDTLTANVSSTDLDGDRVLLSYDWTVNGVPVGASGDTLAGWIYFDRDDVVAVTVTPTDGSDVGSSLTSSGVTIRNTAPTAPVVAIDPAVPVTGDSLFCDVTTDATDADGDTITYTFSWEQDGVAFGSASTDVWTGDTVAGAYVQDQEAWLCSVTASDDVATGSAGEDEVTIGGSCGDGSVTLTASGIDFITVCAQTFDMGCTAGQSGCESDESPVTSVTLTNAYYVSQTEVTQGDYQSIMGTNPSYDPGCGATCPVEQVTWHMAAAFANAVSLANGLTQCYSCTGTGASVSCTASGNPYTCEGYRLPTEAEWEAAARCGDDLLYAGSNTVNNVSWYVSNSTGGLHAVAGKFENACGLYDMSGNAYEWIQDWYSSSTYTSAGATDPLGAGSGTQRVLRGGSWNDSAVYSRVASRHVYAPTNRTSNVGFRIVRKAP